MKKHPVSITTVRNEFWNRLAVVVRSNLIWSVHGNRTPSDSPWSALAADQISKTKVHKTVDCLLMKYTTMLPM